MNKGKHKTCRITLYSVLYLRITRGARALITPHLLTMCAAQIVNTINSLQTQQSRIGKNTVNSPSYEDLKQ